MSGHCPVVLLAMYCDLKPSTYAHFAVGPDDNGWSCLASDQVTGSQYIVSQGQICFACETITHDTSDEYLKTCAQGHTFYVFRSEQSWCKHDPTVPKCRWVAAQDGGNIQCQRCIFYR